MDRVARGEFQDGVNTNHGCDVVTTTLGASPSVFVNGIGVHRRTDLNTSHKFPCGDSCCPHQTRIVLGSTTVFANNPPRGVARVGDLYDGGEEVSTGSENVFAGG